LIGIFALVGSTAHAQVTISVTGTADATGLGYTLGQTYTFTYTIAPSVTSNGFSFSNATNTLWYDYNLSHDPLFTSVTAPGLAGTFTRPPGTTDPHSFIQIRHPSGVDTLEVSASSQSGDIGLTVSGFAVQYAYFYLTNAGTAFAYPGTYTDPATFFQSYTGTYNTTAGATHYLDIYAPTGSPTHAYFTISSLTIAAVPEPSTYAAFAGAAALGLAFLRRRLLARS
jgi:hypothetical protein